MEYNQKIKKMVESSRAHNKRTKITEDVIINGIKFICENQEIDHEELVKNLLALGCNFSKKDIENEFGNEILLFYGLQEGDLASGATAILFARDSLEGYSYIKDRFLANDDVISLYNYIRKLTKDSLYTKTFIESLNSNKLKLTKK